MDPEVQVAEPLDEKADETVNSDENQPDDSQPAPGDPQSDDATKPEIPEGFVPKEQFDELQNRYNNSSSEALVLREAAQKAEQARRELITEPTESELLAAFPEWELMTDTEKRLARTSFTADRRSSQLLAEREQEKATARWNTDLELAIAKNPTLQGKEQAFKEFANKPTHRGIDTDVLVGAFLHKSGQPVAPKSSPKAALESGNGGPRGPISSKKYSAEEQMAIQTNDPKKYREMLLAGAFDE